MEEPFVCRVLTGPTASGKSDLAMRLAEENHWEIICMDSMQIYRRMDIGTAKPSPEDRKKVQHHLLDICEPTETYNVSMYIDDAFRKADELFRSGKEFLFVGGTGLYLEGMMKPMGMGSVPADERLRTELHRLAGLPDGRRLLDERLRRCDPETADRLPLNDIRRRIRAIEVSETTGTPFSRQPHRKKDSPFMWIPVCICPERQTLYERINRRTVRMIENGLAQEVAGLLESGVPEESQSMQAIGYKEMVPYLRGEYTLQQATELIQTRTRHYAKRQITFLKRLEGIQYADPDSPDAYNKIKQILRGNV